MNLMPVYEKWEAEKIAEGEQSKGIAIARRMLTRGIPPDWLTKLQDAAVETAATQAKPAFAG